MGTNYYHRTNICDCCGRYDEQHICKSLTSFESPIRQVDEPEGGVRWVPHLTSWQAWKQHLLSGGEVWDEYGEQHKVDDFIAAVETTDFASRRRQVDWMLRNKPERVVTKPAEGKDWLDGDGFSFYGGAFS